MEDWKRLCNNFGVDWSNLNNLNKEEDNKNNQEKQEKQIKQAKEVQLEDYNKYFVNVSSLLLQQVTRNTSL